LPHGGKAIFDLLPPWGKACPASAGVGMGVKTLKKKLNDFAKYIKYFKLGVEK
jgi:hypothetical protein